MIKKKINKLKTVNPQTDENKVLQPKVLDNVGDLFDELYYIYKDKHNEEKDGLNTKKKLFYYEKLRLTDDYQYESEEEKKEEKEQQTSKKEPLKKPTKDDVSNFNELVNKKETGINYELFEKHIKFKRPSDMLKSVYKTNDKKNNSKLVNIIKSGLSDLKNKTEDMSEEEKEIEKPGEKIDIVKEILKFNKQNQQGQGLKMLTSDQMLSRLPISLAQLKAGNNSKKLKNEIRQLLYFLYRSKRLTKQLYKSLIDII